MSYFGKVECPDCSSPLSAEASVCPYCYSSALATAPWKSRFSILGIILLVIIIGGTWVLKSVYGIDLNEILQHSF